MSNYNFSIRAVIIMSSGESFFAIGHSSQFILPVFDRKVPIFISFSMKTCCGYSLEVPHRGASNEYPHDMFLWRFLGYPSYLELCLIITFLSFYFRSVIIMSSGESFCAIGHSGQFILLILV